MSKILVTGATGTIGSTVVQELENRNVNFVAATRNTDSLKENSVLFSYNDPSTFKTATNGVDKVFLLGPPLRYDVEALITPFINFLKEAGIKRVVYLSAFKAEKMEKLNFHPIIEQKLKSEGFDYTFIRPSFFAQNFKNYEAENINERGTTYMPAGDGKVGFIDANNIAEVIAIALTEEGHANKTYELTGSELLSYADAATILSNITGKNIVYPNPSPTEFKNTLLATGAPAFIADYLIEVYGIIAKDEVAVITKDYKAVTKKEPTSLKEVLQNDFK